mgnify:CR=1 FL=1
MIKQKGVNAVAEVQVEEVDRGVEEEVLEVGVGPEAGVMAQEFGAGFRVEV